MSKCQSLTIVWVRIYTNPYLPWELRNLYYNAPANSPKCL